MLISRIAFSQTFVSPLSSNGGVDTHVYKSDTVLLEATAVEDGNGAIEGREFSTGFIMLHSPYLSNFFIPVKYGLNDNFQISFSLPYLTKTLVYNNSHYIKSGYGDTMLGLTYSFDLNNFLSCSTTGRITFPTGNVNAQDFYYFIPMGYGGYTTSLQQNISTDYFNAGPASIRLFLSGVGVFYFSSTQRIDQVEKNTFDKTYSWSLMGGIDYQATDNLNVQLKFNYIYVPERQYNTSLDPEKWVDANDSVKQYNLLPFIKYRFFDDITGQIGLIYPLKTTQDNNINDPFDAKCKFVFGLEKRFSDNSESRNEPEEDISTNKSSTSKQSSIASENTKKKTAKNKHKKKK